MVGVPCPSPRKPGHRYRPRPLAGTLRDHPVTESVPTRRARIARDLAGAQQVIDRCSTEIDTVLKVVEEALLLCANAHRLYLSATPDVRRQLTGTAKSEGVCMGAVSDGRGGV